jgi:hypothetical protein
MVTPLAGRTAGVGTTELSVHHNFSTAVASPNSRVSRSKAETAFCALCIQLTGLCACAVAEQDPVRRTWLSTHATGAASATALIVGAAGAGNRGTTGASRAAVGLSGAGGFGEVGSATRLRRTREARPLPFCALAYAFRLFWSIRAEEALTEVGAATPTALGGPCPTWEGGQRAPYEGCSHQPERLTARDGAAGEPSSELVEVAVGSLFAHRCPLSSKGGTRGLAPPSCTT